MESAIVRAVACLAFICFAAHSQAATVLLLASGNDEQDMTLTGILESGGHSVIPGPPYTEVNASTDFSGVHAVFLQVNYNWTGGDMPEDGQAALLNFVMNGGGLVTTEWLVWKHGANKQFTTLYDGVPAVSTASFRDAATVTYTEAVSDPVLNAGLPGDFTFTAENLSGTETHFAAKPGATVYYGSDYIDGEGLIGWGFGTGRVISFSTLVAGSSLADENYARLASNAVDWVSGAIFRDRFQD